MTLATRVRQDHVVSLVCQVYLDHWDPLESRVIVVCLVTSVGLVSVSRDRAVRRESKATLDLRASENQASRDSEARQENKVSAELQADQDPWDRQATASSATPWPCRPTAALRRRDLSAKPILLLFLIIYSYIARFDQPHEKLTKYPNEFKESRYLDH